MVVFAYGIITNIIVVCVALILLAAAVYVLDLCVNVLLTRLQMAEDIKTAIRAVIALILFVIFVAIVLSALGVMPAGWF
jgi:hypothetical protein